MFKAIARFFSKLDNRIASAASAKLGETPAPRTSDRSAPSAASASDAASTSATSAASAPDPRTPTWTATHQAVATPTGEIEETQTGLLIPMAVMSGDGLSTYPLHLTGAHPGMEESDMMALRINLVGLLGEGQRSISNDDVCAVVAERRSYYVLIGTHIATGEQRVQQVGSRVQEPV